MRQVGALLAVAAAAHWAGAQEAINVGEVASLTGKEAAFGQSSHMGTLLAIEQLNAAGGVLGRRLALHTEDNQSKQGESATIVKKLISRDKVVAVLGEVASSRSLEMAPICQHERIPMISPSSTNPRVTQIGNYIFRVCFIDPYQGRVIADFAEQTLHLRKVAVLTSVSSAYSVGLSKYFKERFRDDGGNVEIEQRYSEGDKDFKAQLTAIKATEVEGIFIPGYYTEAALICLQARELGMDLTIFGGDGWEAPELIQIGGSAMEGKFFSTHYSADKKTPEVQGFVQRFRARFDGETPDSMAALGYDSAMVLADAIRRAGEANGRAIRDAIADTRDFDGVTGMTTIDSERNATKAAVIVEVQDGKTNFVRAMPP